MLDHAHIEHKRAIIAQIERTVRSLPNPFMAISAPVRRVAPRGKSLTAERAAAILRETRVRNSMTAKPPRKNGGKR